MIYTILVDKVASPVQSRNSQTYQNRSLILCVLVGVLTLFQNCSKKGVTEDNQSFNIFKSKKAQTTYLKLYDKTLHSWPVPLDEVFVNTTLGKAHVVVAGPKDAPPIILLHGLNASSTMWYPNIETLSSYYRTYAIDFILEPGKSVPKKGSLSRDEIVQWYSDIFDHFNLKKISIVGASRGGWLTMALAIKYPDKINKIVLLSPAQALTAIKMKGKVFTNITFAFFPRRDRLPKVLNTLSFDAKKLNKSYVDQFYVASRYAKINKSIFQMMPFSEDELKTIKIPVMVLIGDHDIINNKKGLERAHNMPLAETEVIEHAGHFLSFDRPDIINKKILNFLGASN
jgi:pimeloyl-ACP methyl ester carboxylesterase